MSNELVEPRSISLVNELKIICKVKKNPFMSAQQVQNVLKDIGGHVSLSMIERQLHNQNLREFTRCKPLLNFKNRRTRLPFTETHKKKPGKFCS